MAAIYLKYLRYICLIVFIAFMFGLSQLYAYVYDSLGPAMLLVIGAAVVAVLWGLLRLIEQRAD